MRPALAALLLLGLACASGPTGPDGEPDPASAIETPVSERPDSLRCGAKCQMRLGRHCPCAGVQGDTGRAEPAASEPAAE